MSQERLTSPLVIRMARPALVGLWLALCIVIGCAAQPAPGGAIKDSPSPVRKFATVPVLAVAENEEANQTVYITRTGTRYHRSGCQYLRQSSIPISLKDAVKLYLPCKRCGPPTLHTNTDSFNPNERWASRD